MKTAIGSNAWRSLMEYRERTAFATIADLFAKDANRFRDFSFEHQGLLLDISKNRIDRAVRDWLVKVAQTADVESARDAMFSGKRINTTEDRQVLHVALRDRSRITDINVAKDISDTMRRLASFTKSIRDGSLKGAKGHSFSNIINIGIGGSHLGPMLVTRALAPGADPNVHFAANIDGHDLDTILTQSNPETTLILISSKSFTTPETLANAKSAASWLTNSLGPEALSKHFVAITSKPEAAKAFGIKQAHIFPIWDWVGGRFSLWSAVGLPAALATSWESYSEMLDGAHEMDYHFQNTPLEKNLPVILALVGIWNINFENLEALALIPYDQRLTNLPAFIQQLDMESNGKRVSFAGDPITEATSPVVFGLTGTNAQHTFHQWLHQGPRRIATEFIGIARPNHNMPDHHDELVANLLAQSEALAMGTSGEKDPHRFCPGNRPNTTIFLETLSPKLLGMLLALYEHKIFVQGVIWGINSFDQFGVELGKHLATNIIPHTKNLEGFDGKFNPSTAGLLNLYRTWRALPK